jgi:hypothetical protein
MHTWSTTSPDTVRFPTLKLPQAGVAEVVPAELVLSVAVRLDLLDEHHPVFPRRHYGMTSIQVRIISGVAMSSNSG